MPSYRFLFHPFIVPPYIEEQHGDQELQDDQDYQYKSDEDPLRLSVAVINPEHLRKIGK